jgi:hypothetical protein
LERGIGIEELLIKNYRHDTRFILKHSIWYG